MVLFILLMCAHLAKFQPALQAQEMRASSLPLAGVYVIDVSDIFTDSHNS